MLFLNDCLSCHVTLSSNPLQYLDITSHTLWSSSCTRANLSRTMQTLFSYSGCSKDIQAVSQISLNLCGNKILRAYHIHVCMDCTNCRSKNYYMCRYDIYTVLLTALWYSPMRPYILWTKGIPIEILKRWRNALATTLDNRQPYKLCTTC